MKKIMILNGSPRKNGKTASLVKAFVEGAKSAGHEVKEIYIDGMNMTSRGNMYGMTEELFAIFSNYLGWKNLGNILGAGKELQAQMLGNSI